MINNNIMIEHTPRQNIQTHRRAFSSSSDQPDFDYKIYRSLLALFSQNINLITKNYHSCIIDLQEHPRIRVSIDQQKQLEDGLVQIYKKMGQKLAKQSIYRNAMARKNYQEFSKQYQPFAQQLKKCQEKSRCFVSVKSQKRIGFRLKNQFTNKMQTGSFGFMRPLQRFAQTSQQTTIQKRSSRPKTQDSKNIPLVCRFNQFKTYGSEQLGNKSSNRSKTTADWYKTPGRVRRSSMQLKLDEIQNVNTETGLIGEQVMVSGNYTKQELWDISKQSKVDEVKPVQQRFSSNRVFAMRKKSNPEQDVSRWGILKQNANGFISAVSSQGYTARSRQKVGGGVW